VRARGSSSVVGARGSSSVVGLGEAGVWWREGEARVC